MMQLTQREKYLLIFAGVFFLFLLVFFSGRKVVQYISEMSESSITAERETSQLEALGREFQALQSVKSGGEASQLETMMPNIENLLNTLNLRDKVISLNPRDTVVQNNFLKKEVLISLREITAAQMLDFIKQTEQNTSNPYKIESFTYRPVLKKTGFYNFTLSLAGFQKKAEGP